MKLIRRLDELALPEKHRIFLRVFLKNVSAISNRSKIERLILFGSCARGDATDKSDIDIAALGEFIDDCTLFELYDCALIKVFGHYINNDIIAITNDLYERHKFSYGAVQKYIEREGADLSGLL